jgi:hypothetical protein
LIQINVLWAARCLTFVMNEFVVNTLAVSKVSEAFAFARLAIPGLEMQNWRRYASHIARHKSRKCGILVIRRKARTHICGFVSYRCGAELVGERVLTAQNLAAIDILNQGAILSALLKQLMLIAHRSNCKVVRIMFSGTEHDQKYLHNALLLLRLGLAFKRAFVIDWELHQSYGSLQLID